MIVFAEANHHAKLQLGVGNNNYVVEQDERLI